VATSPLPPPYTPKAACINFGMRGRVLHIINHATFQLDRFRGFGAPGGRKSLSPIHWRYRPYNIVRTNVLHCDGYVATVVCFCLVTSCWCLRGVFMTGAIQIHIYFTLPTLPQHGFLQDFL